MVLLLAKLFARNLPVFISSSRIQLSIHVLFVNTLLELGLPFSSGKFLFIFFCKYHFQLP